MEKAEIDALLTAHGGRAQIVASLHVLRAPSLSAPAHAFLAEHEGSLATIDLQRWLTRASGDQRSAVERAMARLAEREPTRYEYEIARAPSSRPPAPLVAPAAPGEGFFDPGEILGELDFTAKRPSTAPAALGPAADDGLGGLGGLGDLGDLLGDADLFGDGDGTAKEGSSHPLLDALLAGLPEKPAKKGKAKKARAPAAKPSRAWKEQALAAARDTAEDWAPAVTRLPPELRGAVLVRARVSPRPEERAALLEWLLQNGEPRSRLVELTFALTRLGPAADRLGSWLAEAWIPKLLPDRAAWTRHGPAVLLALVERRDFSAMDALFTAVITGASALGPGGLALAPASGGDALRGPLFTAFARALLGTAANALVGGQHKEALAAAAALASLGPSSRELPTVRGLRRKRSAKGEVATLLSLAERRARGPKAVPALEDFIATVHVLSDALS